MKNLLLTLILLLCSCNSNQSKEVEKPNKPDIKQEIITGWDEYGLSGKVKRITDRSIPAKYNIDEKKWITEENSKYSMNLEVLFERDGRIKEVLSYSLEEINTQEIFTYKNDVLDVVKVYDNESNLIATRTIIDCSPYVKRRKYEVSLGKNNTTNKAELNWENNRIIEASVIEEDLSQETFETNKYEKNRLISSLTKIKKKGKAPEIYEFTYDYLEFDKEDNWTKMGGGITYPDKTVVYSLKERIVEYY